MFSNGITLSTNKFGLSYFFRCWYSPRRVPTRPSQGSFNDFNNIDEFLKNDGIISRNDTLFKEEITTEFPSIKQNGNLDFQSVIDKNEIEWEEKKAKDAEQFLVPSERAKIDLHIALNKIRKSESVEELFSVYQENYTIFRDPEYIKIVKQLRILSCSGLICIDKLQDMITFKGILFYIWKNVQTLTNDEVVNLLCDLTELKVKTNSVIFQSLLQMLKFQINSMDIDLLLSLNKMLSNQENIALVVALRQAIKSIIGNEIQKPLTVGRSEESILEIFYYCVQNKLDMDYFIGDIFALKIKILKLRYSNVKFKSCFNYLKAILLQVSIDDKKLYIYEDILDFLFEQILDFKGKAICLLYWDEIVPKLETGLLLPLSCQAITFLNEIFNFAVENEKWNIKQIIEFGKQFEPKGYMNKEVVNKICNSVLYDDETLSNSDLIWTLIATFISSPTLENEFIAFFCSNYDFSQIIYNKEWLHVAMILMMKNNCPEILLQKIFEAPFLEKCLEDKGNIYDNVLNLNRIINLLPNTDNISVPIATEFKADLSRAIAEFPFHSSILNKIIKNLLRKTVGIGVVSNRNILIDFVILLDNENRPLIINQEYTKKIKYLDVPSYDKKIAVITVPTSLFFKPECKLDISVEADVHLLKKEGFETLVLNEDLLLNLETDEVSELVINKLREIGVNKNWEKKADIRKDKENIKDYRLDNTDTSEDDRLKFADGEKSPPPINQNSNRKWQKYRKVKNTIDKKADIRKDKKNIKDYRLDNTDTNEDDRLKFADGEKSPPPINQNSNRKWHKYIKVIKSPKNNVNSENTTD